MIQKFTGKVWGNRKQAALAHNIQSSNISVQNILSVVSTEPDSLMYCVPTQHGTTQEQLSMVSKFAFASIGSQGTVSGLLVLGFLLKTIAWRVLVGIGALYGCIYLYERLCWTNTAKKNTFKNYVRHATKKLKMIVDLTSANCGHQVQQELSSTCARLYRVVDTATTEMNDKLKPIEGSLGVLESHQKQLKLLRDKANYISNELDIFENNYIKAA